jgi:hypothetical protein
MSDFEFEDKNDYEFKSRAVLGKPSRPALVGWLKDKGIAKDDRVAHIILLVVIIISIIASLILINNQTTTPTLDGFKENQKTEVDNNI